MLAGHIDEIGLITIHIDKDGFLYVDQLGGMDPSLLVGQRVKIINRNGEHILGAIGRKAIHLMKPAERTKGVTMDDIWVDIGASSKAEADKLVEIGDPMVVDVQCKELGKDRLMSRACDDKAGAFIVAEVMRKLSRMDLDSNLGVVGVATVQEEVGLRGATTAGYGIEPDAAIAIDVTFASDHPQTSANKIGDVKLGKGPVLSRGPNMNPILSRDLVDCAKDHDIPYQPVAHARPSGTDTAALQVCRGGGVATTLISIPNRYMHTPVEMVSIKDMDNIIKLIVKYIHRLEANIEYRPMED